ncbi:hypothetical protein ACHQM5_017275 [Ranunculus cassubicifolius]
MESKTSFIFLCMFLSSFLISSQAYDFYVGGRDGWVIKPSESYDHWAQRNRFQVNDTLVFKYKSGSDSVLAVRKQDFDTCSISNPLLKLDGGDSRYKLGNSGPFYFISGNQTNCQKGQKLMLIVLTPRNKRPPTATPPSPAPASPPSTAPASPPSTAPAATPPSSSTTPSSPPAPTPQDAASPPTGGTPSDGSAAPIGDGGQSPPPKPSSSTMLTSSMGFTLACSLLITMARVRIF